MELKDNKHIPKKLLRQLEQDQWTIESLATAKAMRLIRYKSIGVNLAYKIVNEASRLVNEVGLQQSARLDPQPALQPAPETPSPPMSARVRRIKGGN